jgi:succinate dehydrogenase/fumarate reductase iron-sulfur protein
MSTIRTKVFKYDPSHDEEPYYTEYDVPFHEWMTVLEVLRTIHEEFEPTAFDYNCRGGSCGLCTMKVNGIPVFACETVVKEGTDLTIEPLDRFPVIRDLIVDKRTVSARTLSIQPQFLRDTPMTNPQTMDKDAFLSAAILQQCRECMICMSVCPAIETNGFDGYAGPYVMTRIAQRYYDDREGHRAERLHTAVQQGLFNCIECGTCTTVCPKGKILELEDYEYSFIDHVRYFKDMKAAAEESGLTPAAEEPVRPVPETGYTSAEKLSGA